MPTTTARSTREQRDLLRFVRDGLTDSLATVGSRYYLSETQRAAYSVVQRHLAFWAAYEENES